MGVVFEQSKSEDESLGPTAVALFAWFVRIFRRVNADQTRFLAARDVTPSQFGTLSVLLQHDGLTATELGRRTAVQGPTLTGVVDRLEAKGLVTRIGNKRDRRQTHVHLTDSGRDLLRTAIMIDPDGVLCRALGTFSKDERETLLDLLVRLGKEMGDHEYGEIVPLVFKYQEQC